MTNGKDVFGWAVANWDSLAKRAEHWTHTKTTPTPVSVQIAQRFKITEHDAAKIARDAALYVAINRA